MFCCLFGGGGAEFLLVKQFSFNNPMKVTEGLVSLLGIPEYHPWNWYIYLHELMVESYGKCR